MGESPNRPFQLSFNTSLKIDFQGSRVTSDSGLILVRELVERLGFGELIACLAAKLQPGNVHSAGGWEEVLLPEIERQQGMGMEIPAKNCNADAVRS